MAEFGAEQAFCRREIGGAQCGMGFVQGPLPINGHEHLDWEKGREVELGYASFDEAMQKALDGEVRAYCAHLYDQTPSAYLNNDDRWMEGEDRETFKELIQYTFGQPV